jgi:hypothetical protein
VLIMVVLEYDFRAVTELVRITLWEKSSSSSGIERGMWNAQALQNFLDTYGLGIGVGSSRASSWPLVVLSNVGLPGAFIMLLLLISVFMNKVRSEAVEFRAVRAAVIAFLITTGLVGTVFDAGVFFYMLVGLGAAHVFARSDDESSRNVVTSRRRVSPRRARTIGTVSPMS